MALRTAYITYHRAESGYQPDRSPAESIGDWFPKERGETQNDNLDARQVGCPSEGYS